MAGNDNDQDNHCKLFTEWLLNQIKPNSSIITSDTYRDIVSYLTSSSSEDKTTVVVQRKIKRKVDSQGYHLMSYAPLNLENKLFVKVKNVSG